MSYDKLRQLADQVRHATQKLRAAALAAETTLAEVDKALRDITPRKPRPKLTIIRGDKP